MTWADPQKKTSTTTRLKLLIKKMDDDGRLRLVSGFLETPWEIEVVDSDDFDAFGRALETADALVSMSWDGVVPPAPRLTLLQLPGAGIDRIDVSLLAARTTVCNCFEHEIGIAEYVVAAMLDWTIGIRRLDASFRNGDWSGSYLCGPRHGELYGKTLGIVGWGRIAKEAARRAAAFGMRVHACSRTARTDRELGVVVEAMGHLHEMLGTCDFVLIAVPLDEETCGLFGPAEFSAMRGDAVLINPARGAVLQEQALFDALKERQIGGAVIDVWYAYPVQGETRGAPAHLPFHELDNILMTPHASAWTDGLLPRRNHAIANNLDRLARCEPLLNVVRAGSVG